MLAVHYPSAPSSSAAGIVSYLEEDDVALKVKALQKIYQIIDVHWAEICESLALIESLSEESSFPAADLASAIASKCYYHLQEYNDALRCALSAGQYFNVSQKNEYIDIMLSKCIDEYKHQRQQLQHSQQVGSSTSSASEATIITIDPRMEAIIEQMFQRCYNDHTYEQALGIALDTYRLDKVEEVLVQAIGHNQDSIVTYAFHLCQHTRHITLREFRLSVIAILVKYYGQLKIPDYSNMIFGLQYLNQPKEAANVMLGLLQSHDSYDTLLLYQIAFDLLETENQGFILRVIDELNGMVTVSQPTANATAPDTAPDTPDNAITSSSATAPNDTNSNEYKLIQLKRILLDGLDIDLMLHCLCKYSHADINILKDIKTAIEGRSNILHHATIIAHSYMNAGTTRDVFLRENLDWLGRAKNWAKFTTVASIGVVHKGHIHESMNLLQPYLPNATGVSSSPYSEAGALYALGLIHANKGGSGHSSTITYLTDALRNGGNQEVVQHGACLGIGLAAMATGNEELFESLRAILFTDSAVGGEGAAFGIGLLLLGQSDSPLASNILPDLLNYLHDTSHEKIIRALSLAIAMMVYGKEESADVIIDTLVRDRDPIVRYGGMFAIAMAYCGTADNSSIRKLLHIAVSDVSDDVRRAAVISLGFLLFRNPEIVPKLVSLLAESFNPHVRYGTCLCIGIACAGSGNKEAIDILFPLLEDGIDFVRQGAMLSLAMVLQQTSEQRLPQVKKFRDLLTTIITDQFQPILAKSGAILATGILDCSGGNAVISLASKGGGFLKMSATIGMMMFIQHWYWYPLYPMLSLSFTPTMMIGLNAQFDIPTNFHLICNAPPSFFAYNKVEEKKEDQKQVVATAVLSTTMKTKAREARKEAAKKQQQQRLQASTSMEEGTTHTNNEKDNEKEGIITTVSEGEGVDHNKSFDGIPLERIPSHLSTASYLSLEPVEKPISEKPRKIKEPTSFVINNPSRVIPEQLRFLSLPTANDDSTANERYIPIKSKMTSITGIVMLLDEDPTAPETVIRVERLSLGQEEIANPPESFEWDPNDE